MFIFIFLYFICQKKKRVLGYQGPCNISFYTVHRIPLDYCQEVALFCSYHFQEAFCHSVL